MFHCSVGFLAVLQLVWNPWELVLADGAAIIKAMLTSSYRGFSIVTLIIQNIKYTFATSILEEQV